MPRNKQDFTQELNRIFKAAQKQATSTSFNESLVSENDSMSTVIQKVSEATASAFADAVAQPLANAIHKYIDDQVFDVSGLSNGGGTVAGILKSVG